MRFILALANTFSASDLRPNKLIDCPPPAPPTSSPLPPSETGPVCPHLNRLTRGERPLPRWEINYGSLQKPQQVARVFGSHTSSVLSSLLVHMLSISVDPCRDGARRLRRSVSWRSECEKQSWRENRVALDDLGLPATNVDTLIVIKRDSSTHMDTARWNFLNHI